MEWGVNPQRTGHCNVESLPGGHWRKLRRRERAEKRSQETAEALTGTLVLPEAVSESDTPQKDQAV